MKYFAVPSMALPVCSTRFTYGRMHLQALRQVAKGYFIATSLWSTME